MSLKQYYNENPEQIEIGIDEVGRGPMFGRVYTAAVILPKNSNFKYELMKDSKKFTSKKKILEISKYIKENCIDYAISFESEESIDLHNIKNASILAMHNALKSLQNRNKNLIIATNTLILVDGRDFKPFTYFDKNTESIKEIPSVCIEGGDNKYASIAAASILAKVERDNYIDTLCISYPILDEYYQLSKNKGYGTLAHMEGIKNYGISKWHRKSFGICKIAKMIDIY